MVKVAPSILSADFLHLEDDIKMVNEHADLIHVDIMDGVYVPNISLGFPVVEAISKVAKVPLDVHLMISNPEKYIERFVKAGASMISFHHNASSSPIHALSMIRSYGAKAGLVINPDIPVENLYPYLKCTDYVVLMSVFAGFGGQIFIDNVYERISTVKAEMNRQGVDIPIEVDGGVTLDNAEALKAEGVSILVAGSSVFNSDDPVSVIKQLRA